MSLGEYFELLFTDYTLGVITLGTAVLGAVTGMLGSFAVLRKQGGINMCATLWIQAERGFFSQSDGMLG